MISQFAPTFNGRIGVYVSTGLLSICIHVFRYLGFTVFTSVSKSNDNALII